MLNFKEFLHEKWTKYSNEGPAKGTWRGPHQGHEFKMMMNGKKPAALVDHGSEDHEAFKPHIKSGKFISKSFRFGGHRHGSTGHIIAHPSEKYRMHKLAGEFSKPGRDHVKIGILLGYPKHAIKKFMKEQ